MTDGHMNEKFLLITEKPGENFYFCRGDEAREFDRCRSLHGLGSIDATHKRVYRGSAAITINKGFRA